MRIILNQKIVSNFSKMLNDPSLVQAQDYWQKEEFLEKSSIKLSIFKTPFGSISLLYGPRQIGKTASLKLFLSTVQDSETLAFTDCSTILNKADLYQHLTQIIQGKTTLILDEVQEVPDWHKALRALYSEGKLKQTRVWCTGSEARYLLESGERLPGRKGEGLVVFARPWSFAEYMDWFYPEKVESFKSVNFKHVNQTWLNEQNVNWSSCWQEYCLTGGIPRIVGEYRKQKDISDFSWKTYTDWILGTWSKIRTSERSLQALSRRLIETLNSRVSYESLKKGTDIQSANTVKTLLEMQEDHFALRSITRFDLQKDRVMPSKQRKVYPLDPYIAKVFASIGWNVRRLFLENLPVLHLDECVFLTQTYRLFPTESVHYLYRDKSKSEVDFYFENCGFELKSNGKPTNKQLEILKDCPQAFVVQKDKLPLMAYLVGEKRGACEIQA